MISVKGAAIGDARKLVMLALHHLPNHCRFNIVGFGSGLSINGSVVVFVISERPSLAHEELFPTSQHKNRETIAAAHHYITVHQ